MRRGFRLPYLAASNVPPWRSCHPQPSSMEPQPSPAQSSRPALYHYSDAGSFLGMLSSRSLWFSHIKYMNDAEEWFYALRLFEQVLSEYDGVFQDAHKIDPYKIGLG